MGEKLSYLLARSDLEEAARVFGWSLGPPLAKPPLREADHWGAKLARSDWSLVWSRSETYFHTRQRDLQALSRVCPLILCSVQESAMVSGAEAWRDGERTWSILCLDEHDDPVVEGTPPATFAELRDRARDGRGDPSLDADQPFHVPLRLAEAQTGFRYENVLQDGLFVSCHALERTRRGLLTRLFGR